MSDRVFPVPVPYGMVETYAAKGWARFGAWPADFLEMIRLHCNGVIPPRVIALAKDLRATRFWELPADPLPKGKTRVWYGPHMFIVNTDYLLGRTEEP